MSATEPSQEHVIEAMHIFAAAKMKSGASSSQVQAMLVEKGIPQDTATIIVSNALRKNAEARYERGQKHLEIGFYWCVGAVVVAKGMHSWGVPNWTGLYQISLGVDVLGLVLIAKGLTQTGLGGIQILISKVYGRFGKLFSSR